MQIDYGKKNGSLVNKIVNKKMLNLRAFLDFVDDVDEKSIDIKTIKKFFIYKKGFIEVWCFVVNIGNIVNMKVLKKGKGRHGRT